MEHSNEDIGDDDWFRAEWKQIVGQYFGPIYDFDVRTARGPTFTLVVWYQVEQIRGRRTGLGKREDD